jgi:transforming growth factor-beta-induced protein
LSILCTALQATELDAVLNQAGPFTVFAPTDDAFLALGQNTVAALLEESVGLKSLTDILLYHVVPNDSVLADDLVCLGKLEMANGEATRTLCHSRSGRTFQIGYGNSLRNYPEIVDSDIRDTCNGVVHLVDKIIFPRPSSYASSSQVTNNQKRVKNGQINNKVDKTAKSDTSKKSSKNYKSTKR